jgi:flavin reductase (DIM6/NTAB) family NADH-FMN oxidoreductase RutF
MAKLRRDSQTVAASIRDAGEPCSSRSRNRHKVGVSWNLCVRIESIVGTTRVQKLQQKNSILAGVSDTKQLRKALGRFATGVAVMTTCAADGKLEGVTSNSFSSVSLDPPLVLWCLSRKAGSFAGFGQARYFAVNVLASHQVELSRNFSTPQTNKFSGISFRSGIGHCPILIDTIAHFECVTENVVDGGDHAIIIGRVVTAVMTGGEPLIFVDGAYRRSANLNSDPPH